MAKEDLSDLKIYIPHHIRLTREMRIIKWVAENESVFVRYRSTVHDMMSCDLMR